MIALAARSARMMAVVVALATVLSSGVAFAQPVAVRVTPGGLALTTSHAVGSAQPGDLVTGLSPPARLVTEDVAGGWALVQDVSPSAPGDVFLILREQPQAQQWVRIEWGGAVGGSRAAVIELSTPAQLLVRFLQPGAAAPPEGAAVLDANRRLVGVVMDADPLRATAIPAALAIGELRVAAERPVQSAATAPGGIRPAVRATVVPIRRTVPELPAGMTPAVRAAMVELPDSGHPAVALQGDRYLAAARSAFPDLERGCGTGQGVSAAPSATLVSVDRLSGLALLRLASPRGGPGGAGLPVAPTAPGAGSTVFVVPREGAGVRGTVVSATDTDVHIRFAARVDAPTGTPVVDTDGRLSGLLVHPDCDPRAEGCDAFATVVAPLRAVIADLAPDAPLPVCDAAPAEPGVPHAAVVALGDPSGAFAVHLGADMVYATLANRLHEVASGCLIRRPGYLNSEVLGVDTVANVAIFHVVAPRPVLDAPTAEEAPLVLVDARPPAGRRVRAVVALSDRDPLPLVSGVVIDARADDLLVDFDALPGGGSMGLVQGAPVIDADGRVVGLIDQPVTGRRYRLRSAAAIRRLLTTVRRDASTEMCFPTFGGTLGFVTSVTAMVGLELGTLATQGTQYNLTGGVFWYNTWYFRGDAGLRLSDEPLARISLAGGPLVFRTGGDGLMGIGLHIELEAWPNRDLARADRNGAQRALYGFEIQGMPYVTNCFGLVFTLAAGVVQYGNLNGNDFGFGITYAMGVAFGSMRHDRP